MSPIGSLLEFILPARDRLWKTRMALLATALFLTAVGIAFVHSTTAEEREVFPSELAHTQLLKAAVGAAALLALIIIDYRTIERFSYLLYGGLVAVLAALLIAKRLSGEGLMRWVQVGFLNIQPSELMKLSLILALARYLKFRSDLRSLAGLAPPLILTLVPFFLVVAQPNLGTALMLPPILLAILFVGGARRSYLAAAILSGALLFPAIYVLKEVLPEVSSKIVKDYQFRRLDAFFRRDATTRQDDGYQLQQSLIAFKDGGVRGLGYRQGPQNTGDFLPAKHTDFIFPVIGEEWGFLGSLSVVLAFLLLVTLCLTVSIHTREPFGRLVASAIGVGFAVQGFENMGMTLGLTPITGVPLPFISFGGSSLVSSFLALGLVMSVAFRRVRVVASQDLTSPEVEKVIIVVDEHPAGAQRFGG